MEGDAFHRRHKGSSVMFFDILLALGLPLTLSSALRFPDLGIGVGEVLLATWIVSAALRARSRPTGDQIGEQAANALWLPALFWLNVMPVLAAGTVLSIITRLSDPPDRYRDLIAYGLVAMLLLAFWWHRFSQRRLVSVFAIATLIYVVSSLGSLIYYWSVGEAIFGIEYNGRFSALSSNANQPGFALAPIPFLALYFGHMRVNGMPLWIWAAVSVAAVIVGASTESDGLALAWYVGGAAAAFASVSRILAPSGESATSAAAITGLALLAVVSLGGTALYLFESETTLNLVNALTKGWDGGDSRLDLWSNALARIPESPLVGFGVGAHSFFTGADARFGTEAHNSLIDWTLQTGILGLALLLWFYTRLGLAAWRSGSPMLIGAVVALMIQPLTSFAYRHPIFWVNATVILLLASTCERTASRSNRRGLVTELAR